MLDPNTPSLLYFADQYMYVRNNTTGTWITHLGAKYLGNPVNAMDIAPSDSNRIYAAAAEGFIWMSADAGMSWNQINGNLTVVKNYAFDLASVSVNPRNAFDVLVGFRHVGLPGAGRLWRCTNTAANPPVWTDVSAYGTAAALPVTAVNAILHDPTSPTSSWFVGTDIGVFYTTNGGLSWRNATQPLGLPNVPVTQLRATTNTALLYAATWGRGVWSISIDCPPMKCLAGSCGTVTNACGDVMCCGTCCY
jgi:hypothetical protein